MDSYSWPLFILSHLRTVREQVLLSDTYSLRVALCFSMTLRLCLAAVGCSLQ